MDIKHTFGKILCGALLIVSLSMAGCGSGTGGGEQGENPPKEEEKRQMTDHAVYDGVALPDSLWQETPAVLDDKENDRTERDIKGTIKAIYYRSDYDGEESYAFAYLGVPEGATETQKAPAVLLIHGGGGTAYWQWVKEWVNRGYVALAMDLEGHVPKWEGTSDNAPADLYTASQYRTPYNQNYGDADLPIEKTWMYYAVSTAIRGNTLLHSLGYVDEYKVGVCGVSWGGVITSIITGYDDRFAFSVPIYCALNIAESGGNLAGYYKNHSAARVWDDDTGLSRVETPLFLLAMNNDVSAYPDSLSATAEHCKNAGFALVRDWLHSHSHAFARPEPYAFADSVVKGGEGLVKILSRPNGLKGTVKVAVPEGRRVKAYIAYTNWTPRTKIPTFEHIRLTVENGEAAYELTDEMDEEVGGATHFYIWFTDDLNRVVSTYLQTV